MVPGPDLEDFAKWISVESASKRYRKRTVGRFTAWICEQSSTRGFEWWVVEDPVGAYVLWSERDEDPPIGHAPPPMNAPTEYTRARCALRPAQLQAMLDAVLDVMHRVVVIRHTGEVPMVK